MDAQTSSSGKRLLRNDLLAQAIDYILLRTTPEDKAKAEALFATEEERLKNICIHRPKNLKQRLNKENALISASDRNFCACMGDRSAVDFLKAMRFTCLYDRVIRKPGKRFYKTNECAAGATEKADDVACTELVNAIETDEWNKIRARDKIVEDYIDDTMRPDLKDDFSRGGIVPEWPQGRPVTTSLQKLQYFIRSDDFIPEIYEEKLAQYAAIGNTIANPLAQDDFKIFCQTRNMRQNIQAYNVTWQYMIGKRLFVPVEEGYPEIKPGVLKTLKVDTQMVFGSPRRDTNNLDMN